MTRLHFIFIFNFKGTGVNAIRIDKRSKSAVRADLNGSHLVPADGCRAAWRVYIADLGGKAGVARRPFATKVMYLVLCRSVVMDGIFSIIC